MAADPADQLILCRRAFAKRHIMKLPRRRVLHLIAIAAASPTMPRIARAQTYPARPIRLVIPFPPGGAFDTVGRPLADKMRRRWQYLG
jgi:tripartite-type tricarboxylate transporter receptor subunit TctC